jgi:hypothetical protein
MTIEKDSLIYATQRAVASDLEMLRLWRISPRLR